MVPFVGSLCWFRLLVVCVDCVCLSCVGSMWLCLVLVSCFGSASFCFVLVPCGGSVCWFRGSIPRVGPMCWSRVSNLFGWFLELVS